MIRRARDAAAALAAQMGVQLSIPLFQGGDPAEDARMESAMNAMEKEFASVDENDPKAMARMMRRMSELTGEKIDGEMEEVVRKLEEGADPCRQHGGIMHHLLPVVGLQPVIVVVLLVAVPGFDARALLRPRRRRNRGDHAQAYSSGLKFIATPFMQ